MDLAPSCPFTAFPQLFRDRRLQRPRRKIMPHDNKRIWIAFRVREYKVIHLPEDRKQGIDISC